MSEPFREDEFRFYEIGRAHGWSDEQIGEILDDGSVYGDGWNTGAETLYHQDMSHCPYAYPVKVARWVQAWTDGAVWYLLSSQGIETH